MDIQLYLSKAWNALENMAKVIVSIVEFAERHPTGAALLIVFSVMLLYCSVMLLYWAIVIR